MRMPPEESINIAVAWLEANEGIDGESAACAAVARWLIEQCENRTMREIAKEAGVPAAALRKRINSNRRGTP